MGWRRSAVPGASPALAFTAIACRRPRHRDGVDRWARCRMPRWPQRSRPCSPPARSMVRAIARSGRVGIRTSLRRVLRLMREHDLLAPGRVGLPRGPRSHDGTIVPDTIDTMWGTDLTTTFTGEGPAAVFIAVDHCSAECVGIHAHARATR